MTARLAAAHLASLVLYLVPFFVVQLARARRDRALWAIALDLPATAAVDLLTILVASLFVRLDVAAMLSRPVWVLAGAAWVVRRRRRGDRPVWPHALGRGEILTALGSAAATYWICSWISDSHFVWDSEWHTSLVAAIAAQRLPFVNALGHTDVLHYHFAGDVQAALIRTLSWNVVSANRALASGHDLSFCLAAATVSLLVLDRGGVRSWPTSLLGVAVLMHGAIPVRDGLGFAAFGYAYHAFFNMSYRPHMALGALLQIGIYGAIATRIEGLATEKERRVLPQLAAAVGLLAVTDETSTALACLALAGTWLARAEIVARGRLRGLFVLVALAVGILAVNLAFHATLSPGGPVQHSSLSPAWRVPSLDIRFPALPISTEPGRHVLFVDLAPLLAAWGAVALSALRARDGSRWLVALYGALVMAVALPVALRLNINGDQTEGHRFFVAPFFALVLFAVLEIPRVASGSLARLLALTGVAVPAILSTVWAHEGAQTFMQPQAPAVRAGLGGDVFDTDCRLATGARLFDDPRVLYVEQSTFFRFVGCRPTFSPGKPMASWTTGIEPLTTPLEQLSRLSAEIPHGEIQAICRREGSTDPVCLLALRPRSSCRAEGTEFLRCPLTEQARHALLRR